ncbi:fimbria/pilus outer membrane usher protein [Candidatus Berkiella cookevillensis]|uniref:Fimbria/pilus outer membrane usher protein n=1 Tax=Candidatus Berkiella cookevillensis TaxID=437022 RepID=A0A0Q9Y946_9GAMM|nr:fimbria/pilus outer membrane usher protein [Candidatus Berkiella cookevillensis]MCS5707366.1 fimbria/pilus outer membrane usher protein [Candidatus Berkiella cookevillensis]
MSTEWGAGHSTAEILFVKPINYQEYVYDLYINQVKQPQMIYLIEDNTGNLYINECANSKLSLAALNLKEKTINTYRFFLLEKKDKLKYSLDKKNQTLSISLHPSLLSNQYIEADESKHVRCDKPAKGNFFNYDIAAQNNSFSNSNYLGGIGEWINFSSNAFTRLQFLANHSREKSQVTRLDTTWQQDLPASITTWKVGDFLSGQDAWSSTARLGGIQYARNFQTQPYYITYPLPAYSGEAVLPTQVQYYINDQIRLTQDVTAGPFVIDGLPVIDGFNNINVQTKDLLNRVSIVSLPFYASTELLKKSLTSFSYEFGFIRENYGLKSHDYGRAIFIGTHLLGVTDQWTLGGHFEIADKQQIAGISTRNLIGTLGILTTAISASQYNQMQGSQLFLQFIRNAQTITFGGHLIATTPHYYQLNILENEFTPFLTTLGFTSFNLNRHGTINLSHAHQQYRAIPNINISTLSYQRSLFQRYYLLLNYLQKYNQTRDKEFQLSLIWSPQNNYTASVVGGYEDNNSKENRIARATFQKSTPQDKGLGYFLLAEQNEYTNASADALYNGKYAQYRGRLSRFRNTNNAELSTAGSIAMIGKDIFFSKPIYDSFAIVNTDGLENISVYEGGQLIGKTNTDGNILVHRLRSYERNNLKISLKDLPLNMHVDTATQELIPYSHSGYLLNFNIKKYNSILFELVDQRRQSIPVGGYVTMTGKTEKYPIGYAGKIFIQDVSNNLTSLTGIAYYENTQCHFSVPIKYSNAPIAELGTIVCYEQK